ncbi:MAG TPA: hypothetical protein VMI10_18970 [Terriglobales bacterium]|nr:hypothetical protein [Terriglobales bacterium]
MPQYLVAVYQSDGYKPPVETEAMTEKIRRKQVNKISWRAVHQTLESTAT